MTPSSSQETSSTEPSPVKGSRLIGRLLPAAVKLWLKTQVEHIEALSFDLQGSDRQILSGHVPHISVSADQAIYRGIHISQVNLAATEVRFNLGQVIRGKALRLLQAFFVTGQVQLTEVDLNESLKADYLAEGIRNFWQTLFSMPDVSQELIHYYDNIEAGGRVSIDLAHCQSSAKITPGYLTLSLTQTPSTSPCTIILQAQLTLKEDRYLLLKQPHWVKEVDSKQEVLDGIPSQALADFQWDLGTEACLQRLSLEDGYMICEGQLRVKP